MSPTPTAAGDHELAAAFPLRPDTRTRLQARLEQAAAAGGLLDLGHRFLDTPVGPLLLVASEQGLLRIAYQREGFDLVLADLARRISPRIVAAPRRLDTAAVQLGEYFAGRRQSFELVLDRRLSAGFRRTVQSYLPQIPYGETLSYAQVADGVGHPRAVRAVGTACATNPLPVVVPCHRVLRSDGSIGGYAGGSEAKTILLALERAA